MVAGLKARSLMSTVVLEAWACVGRTSARPASIKLAATSAVVSAVVLIRRTVGDSPGGSAGTAHHLWRHPRISNERKDAEVSTFPKTVRSSGSGPHRGQHPR